MNQSLWTVRQLEPATLKQLHERCSALNQKLESAGSPSMPAAPSHDARVRVKQQVAVIAALSVAKLRSLSNLMRCSMENRDWLTYGMVGRSIIEHAATLRYYLREKIVPLLHTNPEELPSEALAEIQQIFFQLIRGGRFDWSRLLEQWLEGVALPDSPIPAQPTQVNVLTCIQKWNKEDSRVEQLYAMFCDLVHPNLGSSLLVVGITAETLSFGGACENSLGEAIACGTGLAILGVAESYLRAIERMQETVKQWDGLGA